MMKNWVLVSGMLVLAWSFLGSCTPQTEYEKLVEENLKSGERYDSLFFGFYLGMSMDSFYNRCWEMNRDSLVRQGPMNQSVLYEMPNTFNHPAEMFFYPYPYQGKVYEMPVRFSYNAWSPWNKQFHSDKLRPHVLKYMEEQYPGPFLQTRDKDGQEVYVQVKGNRRIMIGLDSDQYVKVVFTDLSKEQEYLNTKKQAVQ